MENPNLNQIMSARLDAILTQLATLRNALKDRWIATDTHLYEKVEGSLRDMKVYMFDADPAELEKTFADYTAAVDTYNASMIEVKEVRSLTGETFKLRVQKRPPRMGTVMREVKDRWGQPSGIMISSTDHSNEELLAEQVVVETAKGSIFSNGKFFPNPFISDGLGKAPNEAPVVVEAGTDLPAKESGGRVDFANSSSLEGILGEK